jgi:hypothetical protein
LLFKREDTLRIIPLTDSIGEELLKSSHFFQEEQTGNLPVFQTLNTDKRLISVGKYKFQFRSVPFSIKLRDQTVWESTFDKSNRETSYFFSPMMEMELVGDFSENMGPTHTLEKIFRDFDNQVKRRLVHTKYTNGFIKPVQPLPSPGQYILKVAFEKDDPVSIRFNLLPIKSIKLIGDMHIQLKMYAPVKDFQLLGEHSCTNSFAKNVIDIKCLEYGEQNIEGELCYRNNEGQLLKSVIRFKFSAIQEVVGHFKTTIMSQAHESLLIEEDLIANSYLEFHRTSFRNSSVPYRISAYLEHYDPRMYVFPKKIVMYSTEEAKSYSLAPLVTEVRSNHYSRLLLIVDYDGTELFRVEFHSKRTYIGNLIQEWEQGKYSSLRVMPLVSLVPEDYHSATSLPSNSMVYGLKNDENGTPYIATFPMYTESELPLTSEGIRGFIVRYAQGIKSYEELKNQLVQIFQSPDQTYQLMKWMTEANQWCNPFDIKSFVNLVDTFPFLIAWFELARNPKNRTELYSIAIKEAYHQGKEGELYTPQLRRVLNHPRFSPELLTIKDIELLETLNLLPTETTPMGLLSFCCMPFITNGKPVLSWLMMFWLRSYCNRQGKLTDFKTCFNIAEKMRIPLVTMVAKEYAEEPPYLAQDVKSEQDLEKIINDEQTHSLNPPVTRLGGLGPFLEALKRPEFSTGLNNIISKKPLLFAKPYLESNKISTKWLGIIFVSLTAVCTQLNKTSFLKELQTLWPFDHKTYAYLLKWLNNHEETAQIYNAYYEYWMTQFWEESNV